MAAQAGRTVDEVALDLLASSVDYDDGSASSRMGAAPDVKVDCSTTIGRGSNRPPRSRLMQGLHRRRPMKLRDGRHHLCGAILFACICVVSCSEIASRAREEKNEADAAQRLRDVRAAEKTFKARHDRFGTLDELVAAGVLGLSRQTQRARLIG
jgi:hypothetical protein